MKNNQFIILGLMALLVLACENKSTSDKPKTSSSANESYIKAPSFSEDSAYNYIQRQVHFGPRVPNSEAHVKCGDYLVSFFKQNNLQVIEQNFQAKAFDGTMLRSRNIIATLNPNASKRLLLAAHWDSRPFAEKDSINKSTPIDGANDGASGVGVLMAISSAIKQASTQPKVGIDIVLFDSEDYGHSEGMPGNGSADSWCLGSQYWAKNKHTPNYSAYYGILLDMVGAKDAVFALEGTSMHYAPNVMQKVWEIAAKSGYANFFINKNVSAITDDHTYVNQLAKIPMIDIIEFNDEKQEFFGWYHHTHQDNINVIDKSTLKAVGQTLMEVIYNE